MLRIFFDDRATAPKTARDGDELVSRTLGTGVVVRRLLREFVKPYWGYVAATIVAMIFGAATNGLLPFLMQRAADEIFVAKSQAYLYGLPIAVILVMGLRSASDYFSRVSQGYVSNRIIADLRAQLFEKLTFADMGWLQKAHSGRFVSIFMNDVNSVNGAATQSLTGLVQNGLQVVFLAVAMIYMDPLLATIVLAALPLGGGMIRKRRHKASAAATGSMQQTGQLGSIMTQTLQSIRVVKAYHREANEVSRARAMIERTFGHAMAMVRARAATGPVTEGLSGIAIAGAIFYGGWQGIYGTLTLGAFMGFMTAAMLLYQPVKALAGLHNTLIEGTIAASRVFAILDQVPAIDERPDARPLVAAGGSIRLDRVTFGYDADKPVLHDFSLDIPAGTHVALVGPSGSGKSTVMNLVLRFFDPQSGRVLIDGQDLRGATLASVRQASALLTQEPVLFDDTIQANIRYGSETATDAEVAAAAHSAAADEFIRALPEGYLTEVGENGGFLSGGQKQRIAFARAMLRGAPILLLDEPTSALDANAEAKVQEALDQLIEGRTVIVIAHRLSTVKKADVIHVLDQGRIVESGSHDQLVAKGGLYSHLHRTQFKTDAEPDGADAPAGAALALAVGG